MEHKLHIFLLSGILFALIGCTGKPGITNPLQPNPLRQSGADSLYTEGTAMSIHLQDPERALVLIDSGVIVGNIAWDCGEYLKAVVQYGEMNHALARQTCLDLLHDASHRTDVDSVNIMHTHMLLTAIENNFGNHPAVIRHATKASQMAHALDETECVAEMEGYIARAMSMTGNNEKAIARLHNVVDELRQTYTFDGMISYFSTAKKLLHVLDDDERYSEMVPVCEAMLEHISEFADHYDRFADIPGDFDPKDFEDFARGQTLAFLTIAYARQYTAVKVGAGPVPARTGPVPAHDLLQKALATETEMERTRWSKTLDCDRLMTSAYHHLGQFDRFDAAMDHLDSTRTDTLNSNYVIALKARCAAADMRGRTAEALRYLQRAFAVHDSVDARNQREQLNELATIYHLQEEQLARQQAETQARFLRWVTAAVVVILVLAVGFAAYFFYKRRETMEKNRALVRMIDEMHENEELRMKNEENAVAQPTAQAGSSLFTLYSSFLHLIHDEQFYRNAALDRDTVCQHLGIDRHTLNQLLNTYADGLSLPAYINKVRLDLAYELLRDEPDKSISDIAAAVGFTPQNLRLQFKRRYGITPTEYRQNR